MNTCSNKTTAAVSVPCEMPTEKKKGFDPKLIAENKPFGFDVPKTIYDVAKMSEQQKARIIKNEVDWIKSQVPETYKFKGTEVINRAFGCITYKLIFSRI